jgi:preprotein translocase subunit SecA
MQRLKVDDALPLEVGLVSRLIEQSQTRVEGSNFDVRKHLLEYDDVLNSQRMRIYTDRNRIFEKEDLTGDVIDMLQTELAKRVPEALEDEGGPWKLLAWLDGVQPPITVGKQVFPSFTLRLITDEVMAAVRQAPNLDTLRKALMKVSEAALQAEQEHHLKAIQEQLQTAEDRLDTQIQERIDAVDAFFEGLEVSDETDTRGPAELVAELSSAARISIKMSPEDQRKLRQAPRNYVKQVREAVRSSLYMQAIGRQIGLAERRIDDSLELSPSQLAGQSWNENSRTILETTEAVLEKRKERLTGPAGAIRKDVEGMLERLDRGDVNDQAVLGLLMALPQGERASFDKRSHRRVMTRTTRLTYAFHAATLLENRDAKTITEEVLAHFESAQEAIHLAWGQAEFARLANVSINDLEEQARKRLLETLNLSAASPEAAQPLNSLNEAQQAAITDELGRRALTAIYRHLLLGVITELWVDYLTQMEALRVSIGLEAYAQRDPLVQYKSRAAELYGALQSNIRLGVLNRMFTYRPRDLSLVQTAAPARGDSAPAADEVGEEDDDGEMVPAGESQSPTAPSSDDSRKKKRRRR